MRTINYIIRFGFIFGLLLLISCEPENDTDTKSGFYIEISDGTIITEDDILYYDSTSYIFILKEPLYFSYKESESGDLLENLFTVFVDGDTIYKGLIYPYDYNSCMVPPLQYVIYRDIHKYDRNVLEIKCWGFSDDHRNDSRIISALLKNRLLYRGIELKINSVEVFGLYYGDSVSCEITIHNPDPINYYILDPQKMGESYYNYYNGGIDFIINTTGSIFSFSGIYHSEYGRVNLDDFSLIEANDSRTFTFGSKDYFITFDGVYKCNFSLSHISSSLALRQPNGLIWIGKVSSSIDNIIVKFQ